MQIARWFGTPKGLLPSACILIYLQSALQYLTWVTPPYLPNPWPPPLRNTIGFSLSLILFWLGNHSSSSLGLISGPPSLTDQWEHLHWRTAVVQGDELQLSFQRNVGMVLTTTLVNEYNVFPILDSKQFEFLNFSPWDVDLNLIGWSAQNPGWLILEHNCQVHHNYVTRIMCW